MASEPTGGSTVRELMDEIARLKAQYTAAIVKRNQLRVDRDVWQEAANRYSDQLSTLTAENERLSARVARLEDALEKIKVVPSVRHTSGHVAECAWCNGSADIARSELEEGK